VVPYAPGSGTPNLLYLPNLSQAEAFQILDETVGDPRRDVADGPHRSHSHAADEPQLLNNTLDLRSHTPRDLWIADSPQRAIGLQAAGRAGDSKPGFGVESPNSSSPNQIVGRLRTDLVSAMERRGTLR